MGAGASIEIEIKGIELDIDNIKIDKIDREMGFVYYTCPIKKCVVDSWEARSYMWSISSEYVIDGNGNVIDGYWDEYDKVINGGFVKGVYMVSYKNNISKMMNNQLIDIIKNGINSNVDIECYYGSGYTWTKLNDTFSLGNIKGGIEICNSSDYNAPSLYYAEISSHMMAVDIEWYNDVWCDEERLNKDIYGEDFYDEDEEDLDDDEYEEEIGEDIEYYI